MKCPLIPAAAVSLALTFASFATLSRAATPRPESDINRGVVELETASSAGISVRIAEDLAKVINDGATRRVLPVVGAGSIQNITDLKFLRGIDLAILQADTLEYVRQQNLFPGIESSLTYITTLYKEEFHLLARPEIKSVSDLANQKVSVDVRGAGTAITAARLFDLLKIGVTTTNDDPFTAIEKLRRGEIAAAGFVSGKPAPLFAELIGESGLHFLSIPLDAAANVGFAPARLTAADYPGLVTFNQPIDTVAVGTVLAVANLQVNTPRYRNVANFVEALFTGFQSLLEPGHHPKWSEVNIMAELPGWRRFPPAEQWLQRNARVAALPNTEALKSIFSRFIEERQQASGGPPLSQRDKDQLFEQFERWQRRQPQ